MPSPSESVTRRACGMIGLGLAAGLLVSCGKGSTDSTPPLPLTALARIDLRIDGDTVVVGDTLAVEARGVNREGSVLPLPDPIWSTDDSSVISMSASGVIRARNVGSVRLAVLSAGVVGARTVRVVPRALRVRVVAPDTAQISDNVQLLTEVETAAGQRLTEVAPRFASTDTTVASVLPLSVGQARVTLIGPGSTDLLAIVGRDTTRRKLVVRLTPLRKLTVDIASRIVAVGDSVPLVLTALDTAGRQVATAGTTLSFDPVGSMLVRNGHIVALAPGRVIIQATNGPSSARDTLTAQGPSEFPLDIVDGDGQNPLPFRVILSMERVAAKWRRVIRAAPPGDFVRLNIGDCRNAVPVSQFITGVRVLIKLDTLPARIAGQGGPCAVRSNGLPLLGTISLNIFNWATLSDRKLDDLLQHEVGHVLGIGSVWQRGQFASLVQGDSSVADPIFIGANAVAAFAKLGQSQRFTGRAVPLEIGVRGHWRVTAFPGELMAPTLTTSAQATSSVTVGALRDLGWTVEPEAYDEYTLPDAVLSASVSPRVSGRAAVLEDEILMPKLMVLPGGRLVRLDAQGRPLLK